MTSAAMIRSTGLNSGVLPSVSIGLKSCRLNGCSETLLRYPTSMPARTVALAGSADPPSNAALKRSSRGRHLRKRFSEFQSCELLPSSRSKQAFRRTRGGVKRNRSRRPKQKGGRAPAPNQAVASTGRRYSATGLGAARILSVVSRRRRDPGQVRPQSKLFEFGWLGPQSLPRHIRRRCRCSKAREGSAIARTWCLAWFAVPCIARVSGGSAPAARRACSVLCNVATIGGGWQQSEATSKQ